MELIAEAGFPDGVVNVVTGFGAEAGGPLVDHPDVAKIAFTGSDLSGQKIYEQGAKKLIPVTLELGGKSPNIVFDDADKEAAVMGAISGIFAATGQTCIAGSRLLVQKSIHDEFVARLIEVAKTAKIGDPMSLDTHVGPVTTPPQFKKVMDYLDIAKAEGANCVLGGGAYTGEGPKAASLSSPLFSQVYQTICGLLRKRCLAQCCLSFRLKMRQMRCRLVMISILGWQLVSGHLIWAGDPDVRTASGRHSLGQHLPGGELYDAVWRL